MSSVVQLGLAQFSLVYLLLIVILVIMRRCSIAQEKLLIVASIRMTVQLVIAGFVLTAVFDNPHPAFTLAYFIAMLVYASRRVCNANPGLNKAFQERIVLSMIFPTMLILAFFICLVVGESLFNPQYAIPLAGMIVGNTMTGMTIGVKSFRESTKSNRLQMETLLNLGAKPDAILLPFVRQSLETALLPTMNSMLGMGIVMLPGLMTGQILSGTLPSTAILYQIAIMIAICTSVCLGTFSALYLGYKSMITPRAQILFLE